MIEGTNKIFNSNDWKTLYPREQYGPGTANLMFHYLLALGQSDNNILPQITTKKISVLTNVDGRSGHYKLTPLIIAVMKCRVAVVKAMIDLFGSDTKHLNQADAAGFTPLHHAVICSEEIATLLKNAGASITARTHQRGTPEDISRLTTRGVAPWTADSTFIKIKEGEIVAISALSKEKLKELTGMEEYRDVSYVPPQWLRKFWELPAPRALRDGELEMYNYFRMEPPRKVLVQPCEKLQNKAIYIQELVAHEDIPRRVTLGFYSGEFDPRSNPKNFMETCFPKISETFFLDGIDAQKSGNLARFINCGFPNVFYNENPPTVGIGESPIITLEEIKKGDPILADYGPRVRSNMFCQPHVLFGKERMEAFFQSGLKKVKEDVAVAWAKYQTRVAGSDMTLTDLKTKIHYVLSNQVALLHLHFRGLVLASEWDVYLMNRGSWSIVDEWKDYYSEPHRYILALITAIKKFESRLAGNQELRKSSGQWILNSIGEISLMKILKGMEIIAENPGVSELDVNALKLRLADYDWTADKQFVFGFNNMVNEVYKRNIDTGITREQYLENCKEEKQSLIDAGVSSDDERLLFYDAALKIKKSK